MRYLHDKPSTPDKPIDQLYIGNFVCFGAECVIMMGGNQLHRPDWISTFPLTPEVLAAGDTIIADGCWIGSRAMIMQGVKSVKVLLLQLELWSLKMSPYTIVGGVPAKLLNTVFLRSK